MISLGNMTAADRLEFSALLTRSHFVYVQIQVMDLDMNIISDISNSLLSGEVTVDSTSDISRMCALELFDYSRSIQLDPNDPAVGTAYPTRMVRVTYWVGRTDRSRWFYIPIFTGPITKVDRDGAVLTLEGSGKEVLSSGALWSARSYTRGYNKIDLIRSVLYSIGGENYFDVATTNQVTTKDGAINRDNWTAWSFSKNLAAQLGMQLFYDGAGIARVRVRPSNPVWTFDQTCLMGQPQASYDLSSLVNAVEITGATPKGQKNPIVYKVQADASHPLSPQSLGRAGIPRYFPVIEQNDDFKTLADCKAYGDAVLSNGLLQAIDVACESSVIPHVEEEDLIIFRSDKFAEAVRLQKFTIPLVVSEPNMSIGYNLNVRPSKLSMSLRRP